MGQDECSHDHRMLVMLIFFFSKNACTQQIITINVYLCVSIASLFMGPFIGAAVAIGILLIIIVVLAGILAYTFWQIKHPSHTKHPPNAGVLKFVVAAGKWISPYVP